MVKSEENGLFRSNGFVGMTSARHEVTTGKLAPWGRNVISSRPSCSPSFLHSVPFVTCKAKEMFCPSWFSLFFSPETEKKIHLTESSKVSTVALWMLGPLFRNKTAQKLQVKAPLLDTRPSPTYHFAHKSSSSCRQLQNLDMRTAPTPSAPPTPSHGGPHANMAKVNLYNSLWEQNAAVLTSKPC